ncbi:MAG TPA: bifunctional UDP-sugar hydrolase/5'-nucleotidase [Clostridia bacterium]|nr:bifunctional UDP-sugar hydrolase/5'-nucleotidase [Clostridia bacterium]
MKKYTNIIVLAVLLVGAAAFLTYKNVNFNDLMLKMGYYDKKISIINTADIHGHIVFDGDVGGYYSLDEVQIIMGMPIMKHIADDIKSKNKDCLFLDSGDMFHGTNEANIGKGKGVVDVANNMGYDAMTIGNHDFNFGFDRMMEIKKQLNFPMLSANIYQNGKPAFQQYKIVEVGGKKIGLFGLTVQDALIYTNSRDNKGVSIEDPVKAAAKVVPLLRKSCDMVILISHLGDDIDRQVIKKVNGIDLVLCGHHHFLYKKAKKVKDTYLVEAGGYSTHVGVANVYFKKGKVSKVVWKAISKKNKSFADPKTDSIAEKYHAIAMEASKVKVGHSKITLDGLRSHVRGQETNLGDLLADAMRVQGDADIALMNGGGIRESIPKGNINLYQIGRSLPFINSLVTIKVKGDKIYKALERSVRLYPNSGMNGGFLQVSGIHYVFDGSKPAGERIVKVTKDGKPLDKDKYYKVATNDYLYNGGDGYSELKSAKLLSNGELLKDVLAKYIKSKVKVDSKVEGRIKVINERYK